MDEQNEATPEGTGEAKIKVTRRQPCPCGSGKKFKACCEGDPRYEVADVVADAAPASPEAHKKPPAFSPKSQGQGGFGPPQRQPPAGGKSSSVHRRRV